MQLLTWAASKLAKEGMQAPIGFWGPLGFTRGMDTASFRRRRAIKLRPTMWKSLRTGAAQPSVL